MINVLHFCANKTFLPYFANYPTLYSYILLPPVLIVFLFKYALLGLPPAGLNDPYLTGMLFDLNLNSWLGISRLGSLISGGAVIIITYRFACKRYGARVGLFALLILCLDPYKIFFWHAYHGLPDMAVTLFILCVMMLCYRYLDTQKKRCLSWAATLAGFACSLKLNALVVFFPLVITPLLMPGTKKRWRLYITIILFSAAAFLAGTPGLVISPQHFIKGFAFEGQLLFMQSSNNFLIKLPFWILGALFNNFLIAAILVISILFSFYKPGKDDKLFHALLIPAVFILGVLEKRTLAYLLFLFPFAAVYMARFLQGVICFKEERAWQGPAFSAVVIIFTLLFITHIRYVAQHLKPDNRNIAETWIYQNIPARTSILLDWAYVPKIEFNTLTRFILAENLHTPETDHSNIYNKVLSRHPGKIIYNVEFLHNYLYDLSRINRVPAQYLVTSSACYQRYLHNSKLMSWPNAALNVSQANRVLFYRKLLNHQTSFVLVKTFSEGAGPVVQVFQKKE